VRGTELRSAPWISDVRRYESRLADSQQLRIATGRILPGYQHEPRGELPASAELLGFSDRSDERAGSQRPILGMPSILPVHPCMALRERGHLIAENEYTQGASSYNNIGFLSSLVRRTQGKNRGTVVELQNRR
jgi:hypothetical protein